MVNLNNGQRIQKLLAQQGIGSRRFVEKMIIEQRIVVNGQLASLGQIITAEDEILVDNKVISITSEIPSDILLLNKPTGYICSHDDPQSRKIVFDLLPISYKRYGFIGRLDRQSEGLMLFTRDGEFMQQMMHPSFVVEREYVVKVIGEASKQQLAQLRAGVMLQDGIAKCTRIKTKSSSITTSWLNVVLVSGRNRMIRRMFKEVGLKIERLVRIRFANYILPPDLGHGEYKIISRIGD